MTDRELISLAFAARENAYAPYSRFLVGAAIECRDGKVFTGCNVENSALGESICAERVALTKAVSSGYREFIRIAIAAEGDKYCVPCGSCRQVLSEFSPNIELLCAKTGGHYVSYTLSDLLPYAFTL